MSLTSHTSNGLNLTGLIFDIRRFSVNDGPGIRTTVFFKGCPLDCWWCHNPESQSPMPEVMLWKQRCIRCGACLSKCPIEAIQAVESFAPVEGMGPETAILESIETDREICTVCGSCLEACAAESRQVIGKKMTVEEVMAEIERDRPFFEESGGGVTFSGGEPLMQRSFLLALLKACKEREIHTALDTSGFATWEVIESVRPYVDLFLYDVKLVDEERHKEYTGVENHLILQNLHALAALGQRIIMRVPVIPGVNDDPASFGAICELAGELRLERVDLLPYHPSAQGKYERLAKPYRLPEVKMPPSEHIEALAQQIRAKGLPVNIGG